MFKREIGIFGWEKIECETVMNEILNFLISWEHDALESKQNVPNPVLCIYYFGLFTNLKKSVELLAA